MIKLPEQRSLERYIYIHTKHKKYCFLKNENRFSSTTGCFKAGLGHGHDSPDLSDLSIFPKRLVRQCIFTFLEEKNCNMFVEHWSKTPFSKKP